MTTRENRDKTLLSVVASLRLLKWVTVVYGVSSAIYLIVFSIRFHNYEISSNAEDWAAMAQMLGALLGAPLAVWSVALVLQSMHQQQQQFVAELERENLRLDPNVQKVERTTAPVWENGSLGGESFHLTVRGDAIWLHTSNGEGASPVAVVHPDGKVEILLWKSDGGRFEGFLNYQRSNGTMGWYWISVHAGDAGVNGLAFSLSKSKGPEEAKNAPSRRETRPS